MSEEERERCYCNVLQICYDCWKIDPQDIIELDDEGVCPKCDTAEVVVEPPEEANVSSAPTYDCPGCANGVANQLGHMDEGGCLYTAAEENCDTSSTTAQ